MKKFLLLLLGVSTLLVSCEPKVEPLGIIQLDSGEISGSRSDDGRILSCKGIPYAEPPLGDLRWKGPQSVIPWTGVMACTTYSASPMQPVPSPFLMYTPEYLIPEEPISEDCLYLNVWSGAATAEEKLPVLVWLYGGGFVSGGSACPIYDGEALARRGVIVVSVNYRVGLFGFLAHPELTQESRVSASGNYGLLDQIAALKWVRRNIAAFGGDPDKVTIAGQSAGAASVHSLMISPLASGLFHQAIGESGSALMRTPVSLAEAEQQGKAAADTAGLSDLAALRALPADSLLQAMGNQYIPILDGHVLSKLPREMMTEGSYNDVPLLTGYNADDGFPGSATTAAEFQDILIRWFGPENTETLLKAYPASTDEIAMSSQRLLNTQITFGLPVVDWAILQAGQGEGSTFLYYFDHTPPGPEAFKQYGAHHTAEVPYVFSTLGLVDRPWEPVDEKLSHILATYWTNFVKTGNPNGKNLPVWVEFEVTDPLLMKFSAKKQDVITGMGPIPEERAMDILRSVQY